MTVKAIGGIVAAVAIENAGSPEIRNVEASASGASTNNYGMGNQFGSPVANNLIAIASGPNSYGIRYAGGTTRIINSRLKGDTKGLHITGPNVRITFTQIDGGVFDESAPTECFGTHDSGLGFVPC